MCNVVTNDIAFREGVSVAIHKVLGLTSNYLRNILNLIGQTIQYLMVVYMDTSIYITKPPVLLTRLTILTSAL